MSETPETTTASTAPPGAPAPKPYWLYRFAAWVAIVAGIVFIVSSIFFAGVYANGGMRGHHCHHGHHGHYHGAMFQKGDHRGPGPMFRGSDQSGPGELPPSVTQSPPVAPGR
ncbi:MAG TPA: hypothetical protein VL179_10310 [Mycobacterium sp.]|nr:hypothetical protein [Mycobacterium sp.]